MKYLLVLSLVFFFNSLKAQEVRSSSKKIIPEQRKTEVKQNESERIDGNFHSNKKIIEPKETNPINIEEENKNKSVPLSNKKL